MINVRFNVIDNQTGAEIPNAQIRILETNQTVTNNGVIKLSRACWKNYIAVIEAPGYRAQRMELQKQMWAGCLIVGLIITWIPLLWCYGTAGVQTFYLYKDTSV